MQIYARQGDLVIEKLSSAPAVEFVPASNVVFAGDSSGHTHTLKGNFLMRPDGRRTIVRLAQETVLEHAKPEGHKTVAMPPGDYEIRPLRERGDATDRAVDD